MAVLTETEEISIENMFQDLLRVCTFARTEEARDLIRKAFDLSHKAHGDMRRKSGEPYIVHPLRVARIVVEEIGLCATPPVIAALLHDVVEDNPEYTLDFISDQFGPKVALIVDGLTKIEDVLDKTYSMQAENYRKILLTISEDIRVILVKLADRLHNMRTLDSLPKEKQIKIASETIYLYAPLAHRFGFYPIKQELEDIGLKYRHPKIYNDIVNLLKNSEEDRNSSVEKFMIPIRQKLVENGYKFEMMGRSKSIYSIYYKMKHKNVPFEEIFDLTAVRIVFDPERNITEKKQCWNIYSLITDLYTPRHDRIRDWVSTPKANGYEALHITVMGNDGKWAEVQIRTRRMDEIAEKGFAAHWKYKNVSSSESEFDKWIRKIKESLQDPNPDAQDFIADFKMNLFVHEIHVFTPKGQIKTLPQKATVLDFAYEIHSEVGNKAIAAKVNYKLAPLNHVLQSGDQVEIITSDLKRTQQEWLNQVITTKAKTNIKNNIKAENKNHIERGRTILEEALKANNLTINSRVMRKLLAAYQIQSKDELYSKISANFISLDELPKILKSNSKNKWIRYWQLQLFGSKTRTAPSKIESSDSATQNGIQKGADSQFEYQIAKCCNPIPGDDVTGCLSQTNDEIVTIHKVRCPNAVKLTANRSDLIVPVKWTSSKVYSYLEKIEIQGIDRFDIYLQIISKITNELNVNIRTFKMSSHDGIVEGTIELYVHDTNDLENMITELKSLKGVESVKRLEILDQTKETI